MKTDDKIKEILKTMVAFDIKNDLSDEEMRNEFINMFGELVNSDSDLTTSFLPKLIDAMSDILVDMDIIKAEEKPTEPKKSEDSNLDAEIEDLGEPDVKESIDYSKLRSIADRANDFLM